MHVANLLPRPTDQIYHYVKLCPTQYVQQDRSVVGGMQIHGVQGHYQERLKSRLRLDLLFKRRRACEES